MNTTDADGSMSEEESEETVESSDDDDENPAALAQKNRKFQPFIDFTGPKSLLTQLIPFKPASEAIQAVLGVKASDQSLYYVKWHGRSYSHCTFMSKADIINTDGGESAMRKYDRTRLTCNLVPFIGNEKVLALSGISLSPLWFQPERIIDVSEDNSLCLVKWRGQDYDASTWEPANTLEENLFKDIIKRKIIRNRRTLIPMPRFRPGEMFSHLKGPIKSKDGERELKNYQITGVNWLRFCYLAQRNSILADEMGLGKTVQIVITLKNLAECHGLQRPFLIVAPLSTLPHWQSEFESWTDFNALIYHGTTLSKQMIQQYEMLTFDQNKIRATSFIPFDVIITNYETMMSDYEIFQSMQFGYMVVDEGHRLKNSHGKLYLMMQKLAFAHCTILTGTPFQNNVEELWSLLHFLHPFRFPALSPFLQKYGHIEDQQSLEELQRLLQPFLLRRNKEESDKTIAAKEETIISVELTKSQRALYRTVLDDNARILLSKITGRAVNSLNNIKMVLRKICNHPFLIDGSRDQIHQEFRERLGTDDVELTSLIESSGKMILIDKLLPKLKADNRKVLIFSQMVKVLDILEDYLVLKEYLYERISGDVSQQDRQAAIDRFCENPNSFVFLLSTRSGGTGINLTAADTVIIYDSDWNPQNDIQAQARAHRIGQTSLVKVYRLVTRGTYEIEMLDRASKKLGFDKVLMEGLDPGKRRQNEASDIEKILRRGAYDIANDSDTEIDSFKAEDIDQILTRRTTSLKDYKSESLFSKKDFKMEEKGSKEFWSKLLSPNKPKEEEPSVRQCRLKKVVRYGSDDEDDAPAKADNRTKSSKEVKSHSETIIKKLSKYGFSENRANRYILFTAASFVELDKDEEEVIKSLLQVSSLTKPPKDIQEYDTKRNFSRKDVEENALLVVNRVYLYEKIAEILPVIQQSLNSWEVSDALGDPMLEYAILYGINTNGFGDLESVLNGTGVAPEISMNEETVAQLAEKITMQLIDTEGEESTVLPPAEWATKNPSIFDKSGLVDSDYQKLFKTIQLFGLPRLENGEIDLPNLKDHSHFKYLSDETFGEAVQKLDDYINEVDGYKEFANRLGQYGTRNHRVKLKSIVQDFAKIRRTVRHLNEHKDISMAKTRFFDGAPEWWDEEFDKALLTCVAHHGLVYLTEFLVDPNNVFFSRIPNELVEDFANCAEIEKVQKRIQKPKDVGPFGFLYSDRKRLNRCVLYSQAIERHFLNDDDEPAFETLSNNRGANNRAKKQRDSPIIDKLPELPYDCGSSLIIYDFGHFEKPDDQHPVGFRSQRDYFSIVDPREKEKYESSTFLMEDGTMGYKVRQLNEPNAEFIAKAPSGAWEGVIKCVEKAKAKFKQRKRMYTTVSGPLMFGLSNSDVIAAFKIIRQQDS